MSEKSAHVPPDIPQKRESGCFLLKVLVYLSFLYAYIFHFATVSKGL
jgi:hypothetical protein